MSSLLLHMPAKMGKVIDLGGSKVDLGFFFFFFFFALEVHSCQDLKSPSSAYNLINMESWMCCLSEVTFSCPSVEKGLLGHSLYFK